MRGLMTFRIALRALARNKLRAFLTMLGIIIGVGAVIAMVAIGEGAKARVRESFAKMGTNVVVVRSGSSRRWPGCDGSRSTPPASAPPPRSCGRPAGRAPRRGAPAPPR